MSYSLELKVKYLKKIKFLLILFISPIIVLIAKNNSFTTLQTIVALLLNILIWTEVFHQLLIIIFRNYIIKNDNGKYLSNRLVNVFRQLFYLLFIFVIYIISISDSFSFFTTLWVFIISLLLYKFTPKPIMVSHHYFMCNNQIYIIDGFKDLTSLEDKKIKCILIDGEAITITVSNKYRDVLLESLHNILYVKEREMEHLEYDKTTISLSLFKRMVNYFIVFLYLVLLSIPIVIEMVFPILNIDDLQSEYFMNFIITLIVLAGIINGYINRFIITPIKVSEFTRYKQLLHKPLQFLSLLGLVVLAYYHIFKIHDFVLFFVINFVLLIYWVATTTLYFIFLYKKD